LYSRTAIAGQLGELIIGTSVSGQHIEQLGDKPGFRPRDDCLAGSRFTTAAIRVMSGCSSQLLMEAAGSLLVRLPRAA
jgi:hypothetical protein